MSRSDEVNLAVRFNARIEDKNKVASRQRRLKKRIVQLSLRDKQTICTNVRAINYTAKLNRRCRDES